MRRKSSTVRTPLFTRASPILIFLLLDSACALSSSFLETRPESSIKPSSLLSSICILHFIYGELVELFYHAMEKISGEKLLLC